jgi:hypothetical protein
VLDEWSLAEWLLRSLTQQTGVTPGGDLIRRLDNTPPQVLRNLNSLDGEIVAMSAATPLDVAPVLADLLDDAVGDDDRLDLEKAFELLRAEAEAPEPEESDDDQDTDDDEIAPLYDIAHEALGLPSGCADCRAAVARALEHDHDHEGDEEHDHDEHAHDHQRALLDVVFTEHAADLDAWEPQIAWRIARQAGGTFTSRSGLMLLHEAFTHGPGNYDAAAKELAHQLQHLGLSRCEDTAQVQALRLSMAALRDATSPGEALAAAEEVAHQDAAALAYVPASVAVGLVGQRIAEALDRAPAPVPSRRLPKGKRRR